MGLFDFFKSNSKRPSVDLSDYKFLSDDHTRIENGKTLNADNKGAWRGIRVRTSDNDIFFVTMYNMNENHPVWGDNIQMAEKQMKLIDENDSKITLRGFGVDRMGSPFADYGIALHKDKGAINRISLYLHDRNVEIIYKLAESKKQAESLNQISDFDTFKNFIHLWNTKMSMQEKMPIAMKSDQLNNAGVDLYEQGNIPGAMQAFENALKIMPNNDDALKNLKLCYSKIGNQDKIREIETKLNYL